MPPDVFFGIRILQNSVSAGALPQTRWRRGACDAPINPLVGWGGGYPLLISHLLDAFGAWCLTP